RAFSSDCRAGEPNRKVKRNRIQGLSGIPFRRPRSPRHATRKPRAAWRRGDVSERALSNGAPVTLLMKGPYSRVGPPRSVTVTGPGPASRSPPRGHGHDDPKMVRG